MSEKVERGLIVDVYKTGMRDCSNGGISSKVDKMILIGSGVPEIFTPSEDCPAIYLSEIMGQPIAIPKSTIEGKIDGMFGGNFIYSCDSRFRNQVNEYPIRVHDRFEY